MSKDFENLTEEQIVQRLLDAETVPEKTVELKRLGIPVKLRGLTGKQVFNLQEEHTSRTVKKGTTIEKLDMENFNVGLIVLATVTPNWGDPKLLSKFKASSPEEVVKRVLLAGEISQLGDEVLDLSGFNTELEEIKN